MDQLPSNIRKTLIKTVPLTIVNEISCFAFYDNHPQDKKEIDIIVCTKRGEVQEFYKREVGASYFLENTPNIEEIKILRNSKCDLFYLMQAQQKLLILNRNVDSITVLHELNNVASYVYNDTECSGQATLKIVRTDDAVPLIFDENFETYKEKALEFREKIIEENTSHSTPPLLINLERKLAEARYCVKFNESKFKELLNLRQEAIFLMYKRNGPFSLHSKLKLNLQEIPNLMQIETRCPEVIICNKKVLIILNIVNNNHVPLEDVCVFLHSTLKQSITYTTKIFCDLLHSPYWQEKKNINIETDCKATIVTVIELRELQFCPYSKIQFDVVLSYHKEGRALLMPFENVFISSRDIMGDDFDVLSSKKYDAKKIILCILSTSDKKILHLKHLKQTPNDEATLFDIFCTHLKMELLEKTRNIALHKISPYHTLHGMMAVFKDDSNNSVVNIYTRCPSQVLALINYIYDTVPYRIVITTPDVRATAQDTADVETIQSDIQELNYNELCRCLLKQMSVLKEYFDKCLVKMNESKCSMVQAKVGQEIDIAAQGSSRFLELREEIIESTERGIDGLTSPVNEDTILDNTAMAVDE